MSQPGPQPATTPGSSNSRATNVHRNPFGVVSVVLGIIALLTSWLLVGAVFGFAALVTGIVARVRAAHGKAGSPAVAVVGIVLGAVSIIVGLSALLIYRWLNDQSMIHYHQCLVNGVWTHC